MCQKTSGNSVMVHTIQCTETRILKVLEFCMKNTPTYMESQGHEHEMHQLSVFESQNIWPSVTSLGYVIQICDLILDWQSGFPRG